jgi:hypothetical protein
MGAGTEELTKLFLGLRGNAVGKFFFHPHPYKCGHPQTLAVRSLFQFIKGWFIQTQRQHPFLSEHQVFRPWREGDALYIFIFSRSISEYPDSRAICSPLLADRPKSASQTSPGRGFIDQVQHALFYRPGP